MTADGAGSGPGWSGEQALLAALGRLDLRGGRAEHAPHQPQGVDIAFLPRPGSAGGPIFVTAVEDEIHIAAGAGGRWTINNEESGDIDHFVAVITALIDGGGQDLFVHDPVHGYQPCLGVRARGFSVRRTDATFVRDIPPW